MRFTGGLPETPCGAGSTLKVTEHLRANLPPLLRQCGVESLLDAPCGDGNWISQTDLKGIGYFGIDLDPENIQAAIARPHAVGKEPPRRVYQLADVLAGDLPAADAILCRDFFQHIPTPYVLQFLRVAGLGKIKWLLATSFDVHQNEELPAEKFRPLNLEINPFSLGAPRFAIPDPPGSGRILGVWRL